MVQPSRRQFLQRSLSLAAAVPMFASSERDADAKARSTGGGSSVAIVRCRSYEDREVHESLKRSFDLIGGIESLVKAKTITVKLNLTGQDFSPFMDLPVGETYMTHYATAYHLAALLFASGARKVRFVESAGRRTGLEPVLAEAGWNLDALNALGPMAYENTRNRGSFDSYAHLKVPQGLMFTSFDLNRAYADTDVVVSLAKLKEHVTAGVTLTMKNMFGLTPCSLYGGKVGDEDSTAGRGAIHDPRRYFDLELPGLKPDFEPTAAGVRVPYTVADLCAARPVHLAIIDGISSVTGGEGRWESGPRMRVVRPGVLIAGLNPVAVDAVGTAVMGFDPRAQRTGAFAKCENHLLLTEQMRLGTADLKAIDVRGLPVADAIHPFS